MSGKIKNRIMIFIASDPIRLLAIIIIGEKRGESWNKQNLPDHYDDILEKHFNNS